MRSTRALQDQLKPGAQPLNFKTDIEPWLGERAGIFFTDFSDDTTAPSSPR